MASMYSVDKNSFTGWSEDLAKTGAEIMNEVWQQIGYEVLIEIENQSLSRTQMIEIILDADRMETSSSQGLCRRLTEEQKQDRLLACQYIIWLYWFKKKTLWSKFLKMYFPYKTYGI